MKSWKTRGGAAAFLLMAIAISRFFAVEWNEQRPETTENVPRYTLISSLSGTYWDDIAIGAMQQAQSAGMSLKCVTLANSTQEGMIEQIDYAVATAVDGLILMGYLNNQPGIEAVAKAREAGVSVVAIDACAPEMQFNALIGSDNVQAGRMAAREMAAATQGNACVLMVAYSLTARTQNERIEGFKAEIKANYPDMKCVQTIVDGGDMYRLRKNLEQALNEFPGINAIVCVGASSSDMLGSIASLKPKLGGEIKVVCFDTSDNVNRFIQEGLYEATIAQNPVGMGKSAMRVLENIRVGEKIEKQRIHIPLRVLTREALAESDGQEQEKAAWIVY